MKFVVITSVLNDSLGITKTGNSLGKLNPSPEWIIVDGGSSKDSIQVIQHLLSGYVGKSTFLAGPDSGIYNAWNKAIELLDDDSYVIFLGAGDILINESWNTCIDLIAATYRQYKIYSFGVYLNKRLKKIKWLPQIDFIGFEWGRPYLPPHQGVFCHSTILKEFRFDESYRVAADSKFLLRALVINKPLICNLIVSEMDGGGISNQSKRQFKSQREIDRLVRELNLNVPLLHRLMVWLIRFANYSLRIFVR